MPQGLSVRCARRASLDAVPRLALACTTAATSIAVAAAVRSRGPTVVDRRVRRLANARALHGAEAIMWPLFPIGLPGVYIATAYTLAHWLRRHDRRGGPAIVTSAWLAWLAHRGLKLFVSRRRPPRPGDEPRFDSYPSGHTTAATALAVTIAHVLRRERVVSRRTAAAIRVGAPSLMGIYRVIADEHWATDVIGGWTLGAAVGLACSALGRAVER
jgi:undecaprenyl-diphosphatase